VDAAGIVAGKNVPVDEALIGSLDDVAARAVPAGCTREIGGWLARRSPGLHTKRANSVLPRRHPPDEGIEGKLAACEQFYEERGLPVRYQISPASRPAGLEELLVDRGYTASAPTAVQTCDLERLRRGPAAPEATAEIASRPTDGWWRTWQAALGVEPSRLSAVAALLGRLDRRTAFVTVSIDGTSAAVGLGVLDGPWLGIFNMATLPASRRRGAGRTALAALAGWARGRGATGGYLQVELDNQSALELYRGAGFRQAYRYVYLTRAPAT